MNTLMMSYCYLDGTGGGVFATRAYVNAVAELSERAALLVKQKPGLPPEDISPEVAVTPLVENRSKVLKGLRMLLGILHPFRKEMKKALGTGDYDTVFFCSSIASYRLIGLAKSYGCRVITLHHNYEYEYYRDNMRGCVGRVMLHWVKRFERQAVLRSDINLTLTEDDRRLLLGAYGGDPGTFRVTGVFEYCRKAPSEPSAASPGQSFVITGTLSAVQTYEPLGRWVRTYWPILKEEMPGASLKVAGRDPSDRLRVLLEAAGCDVIASPASMGPVLRDASCYICPTDLGGGLKLRIMDGLGAGLPVITHEVSLRGYERFAGRYVFGYHDAESFREALAGYSACAASPEEIRAAYAAEFSFDAGVSRLARIFARP